MPTGQRGYRPLWYANAVQKLKMVRVSNQFRNLCSNAIENYFSFLPNKNEVKLIYIRTDKHFAWWTKRLVRLWAFPMAQLVERKVSDWEVAASWFDSQTGMCRWEKHFTLIFLWGKQSTRCGGPT